MTSRDLDSFTVTTVSVPQNRDNGLWAAMALRVSDRSAAGPWLVGSERSDQPVSLGMFDYGGKATPVVVTAC